MTILQKILAWLESIPAKYAKTVNLTVVEQIVTANEAAGSVAVCQALITNMDQWCSGGTLEKMFFTLLLDGAEIELANLIPVP